MSRENPNKQGRGNLDCTFLDKPKLVSQATATVSGPPTPDTPQRETVDTAGMQSTSSATEKAEPVSLSFMRRLYKDRGFSENATNIILQSWRQSSQKQYDGHIRKWLSFCSQRQVNPTSPSVEVAVEFLTTLYESGLSYSSINSARCALSAILDKPDSAQPTFGEHPDVKRFMKGIYQTRPPLPRYSKTWDVNLVLQYIGSMDASQDLSLRDLTFKLVMLVALTTAQRSQSIHLLDITGMVKEETSYTFLLDSNIKQSKPGGTSSELVVKLSAYPHDKKLCVVNTCSVYLDRTNPLRGNETRLFITHQKPHKRAGRDTIRRWIRRVMTKAGIDISIYKPHSVRSAASSKAKANNASLQEIMKTAGWSSSATFARFYDKEIDTGSSFATSVLSCK